jgi:hypothetical protein
MTERIVLRLGSEGVEKRRTANQIEDEKEKRNVVQALMRAIGCHVT